MGEPPDHISGGSPYLQKHHPIVVDRHGIVGAAVHLQGDGQRAASHAVQAEGVLGPSLPLERCDHCVSHLLHGCAVQGQPHAAAAVLDQARARLYPSSRGQGRPEIAPVSATEGVIEKCPAVWLRSSTAALSQ